MYPKITTDLEILQGNVKNMIRICSKCGISMMAITKGFCAAEPIVQTLVKSGVDALGDSRMDNIRSMREYGIDSTPLWLLRIPMLSELKEVARWADGTLISEIVTAENLSREAAQAGRQLDLLLMVEMGDLREGVMKEHLLKTAKAMSTLPNLTLKGIGANFACFGGVIPTYKVLQELVELRDFLQLELNINLPIVSGGNSSSAGILLEQIPEGISQLRFGEAILFGQEACERKPIPRSSQNVFTLEAEVIEVQTKPSMPTGKIGIDAFGNIPVHEDRGIRKRAIVAVGRQDTVPEDLFPLWQGIKILGSSSDHMILDVEEAFPPIEVGTVIPFRIRYYSAMLQGFTSPYVRKEYK